MSGCTWAVRLFSRERVCVVYLRAHPSAMITSSAGAGFLGHCLRDQEREAPGSLGLQGAGVQSAGTWPS